jgi:hypothetical protein
MGGELAITYQLLVLLSGWVDRTDLGLRIPVLPQAMTPMKGRIAVIY